MKPICIPCQRFMRIVRNGYAFVEKMPIESSAKPGLAEPEKWKPYKLWLGDLYRCPTCGAEAVGGVAHQPIAEHFQPGFAEEVVARNATLEINDC